MITYDFGVTWEKLFINLHLNFSKESKGIPVLKTSGYGNIICNGNEGEYLSFDSNHIGVYYSSDAGISFDKVIC